MINKVAPIKRIYHYYPPIQPIPRKDTEKTPTTSFSEMLNSAIQKSNKR